MYCLQENLNSVICKLHPTTHSGCSRYRWLSNKCSSSNKKVVYQLFPNYFWNKFLQPRVKPLSPCNFNSLVLVCKYWLYGLCYFYKCLTCDFLIKFFSIWRDNIIAPVQESPQLIICFDCRLKLIENSLQFISEQILCFWIVHSNSFFNSVANSTLSDILVVSDASLLC